MRVFSALRAGLFSTAFLFIWGCASTPSTPSAPAPTTAERINNLVADLASQLAAHQQAGGALLRVGVVPFTDKSHQATSFSSTLQERLYTELFRSQKFLVVDKASMDKVIHELQSQDSMADAIKPETLSKLHELVAAQAVVTGAITDAVSDFNIECRLVDTATDTTLAVASGSIGKKGLISSTYVPPINSRTASTGGNPALQPLVAPIALYPDPLLACVLPASTYPDEVQKADVYISANPSATDDQIAAQSWDPSVQAVAHYPPVVHQLATDPQWTASLGAAFTNEQPAVMASIQDLRAQAATEGNLKTTSDQAVVREGSVTYIRPAAEVIVVPVYDPVLVYSQQTTIVYANHYPAGVWLGDRVDWNSRRVYVGDWHGGWVRSGDGSWRRDPNFVRAAPGPQWTHDTRHGAAPTVTKATGYTAPAVMAGRKFTPVPVVSKPTVTTPVATKVQTSPVVSKPQPANILKPPTIPVKPPVKGVPAPKPTVGTPTATPPPTPPAKPKTPPKKDSN